MKILHLLDTVNRGGAEILALDVLRNAAKNNLDLIFAVINGGVLGNDFREAGAVFLKNKRRFPIDPFVIKELRQIIKDNSIDIIHAHQAVEGLHAYLAAIGTKTPIVLSHHGFIADKKNLQTLKFLASRVARNVIVSQALTDWYNSETDLRLNHNLSIIFNGVDEKRLESSGNTLRRELKIADGALLFGMISNFYAAPRKDQLTLCRALPRVFEKIPDAQCVFVGKTETGAEGKFKQCYDFCRENNLSKRVHFLGLRKDVPQILDSLDIFVLSSLHEGMPIAVLEAMLKGIPCVLSDIKPLLEVSAQGEFAAVFPVGNEAALAEHLIKLLQNTEYRKDLGMKTRNYAASNFSIEAHIESLKRLYWMMIKK